MSVFPLFLLLLLLRRPFVTLFPYTTLFRSFASGVRFGIPIVNNGFIPSLNNAVYINFGDGIDRKSTRLNSSHLVISYAVFCLKKKKQQNQEVCCAVIHLYQLTLFTLEVCMG